MKNRTSQQMSFVTALMSGGALGTFVALLLSSTFGRYALLAGIAVGSITSYLSYRPREVATAFMHALRFIMPRTWAVLRAVPGFLTKKREMPFVAGSTIFFGTSIAIAILLSIGYMLANGHSIADDELGPTTVIILMFSYLSGCASTLVANDCLTNVFAHDWKLLKPFRPIYERNGGENFGKGSWTIGKQVFATTGFVLHILAVLFAVLAVVIGMPVFGAVICLKVLLALLKVFAKMVGMVHSSTRAIVSVDGGLGVLVTYLVARTVHGQAFLHLPLLAQCAWSLGGGIVAVSLGLFGAYIVAPRLGFSLLRKEA